MKQGTTNERTKRSAIVVVTNSSSSVCTHCGSEMQQFQISNSSDKRIKEKIISRKSVCWSQWRGFVSMLLILVLPLILLALVILKVQYSTETQLQNIFASERVFDAEGEEGRQDVLMETRTRFVAPSAVRLPRTRRHMKLAEGGGVVALDPEALEEDILWSTGSITSSDDSNDDEYSAENLESQELNWMIAEGTTMEPEVETTETSDWPDDFEDAQAIRSAQARRMLEYMDLDADPCDDFYQYACGRWVERHPIPRDKAGFDTFELLRERLDAQLRELLEQEAGESSAAIAKARNLYRSCMNEDSLKERGSEPLLHLLENLGGWPALDPKWDSQNFDWIRLMAELRRMNNDILIAQWVGPDIKKSDEYVIQLDQTNLGLPTRDYFLHSSNKAYLTAYHTFVMQVIELLGASSEQAKLSADEIVEFETSVASLTARNEDRRNVSALYRRLTLSQLEEWLPKIAWRRYLTLVLGFKPSDTEPIVIYAETYFQGLAELVRNSPPSKVANYLLWRFVRHRVGNLDERFQEVRQRFYCALFGREQAPSRWKDCVAQVNANMGMALGALFVRKHFDENSKKDTLHMTHAMQSAFTEILTQASWLDNETKTVSGDKVAAMTLRIGYPDFILKTSELDDHFSTLNISRELYFENMVALLRHASREERLKLGSVVNKTQWNTAPAVVNAYYSRNKNQIMFPAGILQPPFYHRHFPKSLNFGGIGVVIGHEITHGFDDKGRLFDREGNMKRWWSQGAVNGFHDRAQCLVDQYSKYKVHEVDMLVDGMITQGENIADNGGIKQGFLAYQRWLSEHGDTEEHLPGLNASHHELFFINFAQVWCGAMRPEATRNKLKTAVHAPGKYRVIGTLSNSEDFAKVFKCPLGSQMNPEQKCSVW